jgi:hypothetical protein
MRLARSLALGIMLCSLISFLGVAAAAPIQLNDPEDVKGVLDVRQVRKTGDQSPVFKFITYEGWTVKKIWSRGFLMVEFDTRGDERVDFYALISPTHEHLDGELVRDRRDKKDYVVANFGVWRKSRKSASFRIMLSKMTFGSSRVEYGWRAYTIWNNGNCMQACFDLVPDDGLYYEPVPLPTP